jgi:hypothetical protein
MMDDADADADADIAAIKHIRGSLVLGHGQFAWRELKAPARGRCSEREDALQTYVDACRLNGFQFCVVPLPYLAEKPLESFYDEGALPQVLWAQSVVGLSAPVDCGVTRQAQATAAVRTASWAQHVGISAVILPVRADPDARDVAAVAAYVDNLLQHGDRFSVWVRVPATAWATWDALRHALLRAEHAETRRVCVAQRVRVMVDLGGVELGTVAEGRWKGEPVCVVECGPYWQRMQLEGGSEDDKRAAEVAQAIVGMHTVKWFVVSGDVSGGCEGGLDGHKDTHTHTHTQQVVSESDVPFLLSLWKLQARDESPFAPAAEYKDVLQVPLQPLAGVCVCVCVCVCVYL